MSGSRRSEEDPLASKQTDTDNPFIAFRRALDAQISSIFRSILPSSSAFESTRTPDNKTQGEVNDVFDEFDKKWDTFMENARREASQFYGPGGLLSKHDVTQQLSEQESARRDGDPWTEAEVPRQDFDIKKVDSSSAGSSWLGYDGKRRLRSKEKSGVEEPTPRDSASSPRLLRSRQDERHSWTNLFARLKPRFFEAESGETHHVLGYFQKNAYPDYNLPYESIDDPFDNTPAAVPFLLHSPYSPLNIPFSTFAGRQSSPHEEAKLANYRFKEAFEDLMRLHHGRRMVETSETYTSQRNPSGHPMHWITRLIEAEILGQGWSVWGNGGTRQGLWFANLNTPICINATRHSRLAQMPHIPYQGYVMQQDWFRLDSSNFFKHVEAAVDACNRVSSFAASSALSQRGQDRIKKYEDELCTLQWAAENMSQEISNLECTTCEDNIMSDMVEEKISEIHDRCTNISEYLISKSKALEKTWWYSDNDDELFENGEYLGHSFSGTPFLARAFDKSEFLSYQIRQIKKALETGDNVHATRRAMEEIFVDLHRSKRYVEEALNATGSRWVAGNPQSREVCSSKYVDLYRSIVENLETLKSQFDSEGRWDELSKSWWPVPGSDYWFQDVEAIRSDCFPADLNTSIQLNIPRDFKRLYSNPTFSESPRAIHVRSPEVPYRSESLDLLYEYLDQINYYNDPLTGARGLLSRDNYRWRSSQLYRRGESRTMYGPTHDRSSYSSLLDNVFRLSGIDLDQDAQLGMDFIKEVLCDELCDEQRLLSQDDFLARDVPWSPVGRPRFSEEYFPEQTDGEPELDQDDEQFDSSLRQTERPLPYWTMPSSSEEDEGCEQLEVIADYLSSDPPPPPFASDAATASSEETPTDHPVNPFVSKSTTTTITTLPDGSIQRKSIVRTRYTDGKEEVNETVDHDWPKEREVEREDGRSVGTTTTTTTKSQAQPQAQSQEEEKEKKSWFWK